LSFAEQAFVILLDHPEELDGMRSLAIGGSLTGADADPVLDACVAPHAERAAIAELGPSFGEIRAELNELARIVGG
jgi:hypothetical protein